MYTANKCIAKSALLVSLLLLLSGCLSLPNLNPFSDDDEANNVQEKDDERTELSNKEQSRRDALVAGKSSRPTLKSLDLRPVRADEVAVPTLSLVQKRDQYESLLPLIKDPIQKQQVAFRLADIKMLIAEQGQEEGTDLSIANASYNDAISDYQKVLSEHNIVAPTAGLTLSDEQQALNRKQMDAMYQLTRALDLSAQPDQSLQVAKEFLATFSIEQFNVTPYHLELYFRIGEYYFNRQQYPNAASYYNRVVEYGNGGAQNSANFYAISAYMLGWSEFKLDNYPLAMEAFANMLDASLLLNTSITTSDLQKQPVGELSMTKGELRLVKDAVRVMALTFSYQGNGEAIQSFFEAFGSRDYEQLVYDELAQQHLDNDRFQDSANVLVTFANVNPLHPRAVEFFIRHIDAFVLGEFPTRVLIAKEDFVNTYSLGNGVVNNMDTPIGRDASPYLREYIKQLAQTEHSIAQSIDTLLSERALRKAKEDDANLAQLNASSNSGFVANEVSQDQDNVWALASDTDLQDLRQQAYTKAKAYYQNFIRTFSPSPEVAPLRFYLAEALLALNEFEAAIQEFETFAYVDVINNPTSDMPKAVEAAYAALLVYQKMDELNPQAIETRSSMKFQMPLNKRQTSQANFAEKFANDDRAPTVALTLMQNLFAQTNYLPAQEWAQWILAGAASPQTENAFSNNMQESAMLVMAHSYFAMDAFADAELGYRSLLSAIAPQDDRRQELTDRLAASLYKQAENLLVNAKLDTSSLQAQNITNKTQLTPLQLTTLEQGVSLLQKVVTDTPLSEFRLAAQYDSAVYFSLLENWSQAIATFIDFRQRYPQNPLSKGINEQLLYAYQQTEDWPKAAAILMRKYQNEPNTEVGRLALFQAAEFYEKANDRTNALINFRTYAHQYPMPLAEANEARFNLSEFYAQSNNQAKRRFWLNKMIQTQLELQKNNPQLSTARSVYLASMSNMVFAQDADYAFTNIKLTQPLAKSLQKKQSALSKAIVEYERVISFGSADYVSAANYKLANLYITLADDLMNSSRPDGLSALELSQYDILLEEQAYPFEETAIGLHEKNIARVRAGLYDDWVKNSFIALKNKNPGRYNKPEVIAEVTIDDL
jgi:tetratricopeptide (TPR) repeat protein